MTTPPPAISEAREARNRAFVSVSGQNFVPVQYGIKAEDLEAMTALLALAESQAVEIERLTAEAVLWKGAAIGNMINVTLMDRDHLGREVREAWIKWAETQPAPKASWLVPYDGLSEPDKEADRQIGEHIAVYATIPLTAQVAGLTASLESAEKDTVEIPMSEYFNNHMTSQRVGLSKKERELFESRSEVAKRIAVKIDAQWSSRNALGAAPSITEPGEKL